MKKKTTIFIICYFIYIPLLLVFVMRFISNLTSNGFILLPVLIVLMVAPLIVFLIFYKSPSKKRLQLLLNGIDADASIIRVEDTGVTLNNGIYINLRLFLQVKPQNDQPFEAQTEDFYSRVNFPRPGDTLVVKYNPKDKSEIVLKR